MKKRREALRGLERLDSRLSMRITSQQRKQLERLAGSERGKVPAYMRGLLTALLVQQHNRIEE
jgi:hypothetical protein